MQDLRQSTVVTIMFGPFVDKADGVTLKNDATCVSDIDHATTGIFLSKAGGVAAIRHQSVTSSVADAYGMMKATLDTTDTNTLGQLDVLFAAASRYLPVHKGFNVLSQAVYDAKYGTNGWISPGTGTGQINPSGGRVPADLVYLDGTSIHSTTARQLAVNFLSMFDIPIASWVFTGASRNQTGDCYGTVYAIYNNTLAVAQAGEATNAASSLYASLQTYGNAHWATATGFATVNPDNSTIASIYNIANNSLSVLNGAAGNANLMTAINTRVGKSDLPPLFSCLMIGGNGYVYTEATDNTNTIYEILTDQTFGNAALLAAIGQGGGGGTSTLTKQDVRDAQALAPSDGVTPAAGSIDSKINALAASSGSGAYTLAVTVTDGTNPLEGARVQITKGAVVNAATTDVNGLATFNVNAGTWTFAATAENCSYGGGSHNVAADDTFAIVMTPQAAGVPAMPSQTRCTGTIKDGQDLPRAGVILTFNLVKAGTPGQHQRAQWTAVSATDGSYAIDLAQSSTFTMTIPGDPNVNVTFTTGTNPTFAVPSV